MKKTKNDLMDKKQLKKGKKNIFKWIVHLIVVGILLKEKRWKKKVIVRGGKPSDQTWPRGLIFSLRALLCILKFGRGCPAQGVSLYLGSWVVSALRGYFPLCSTRTVAIDALCPAHISSCLLELSPSFSFRTTKRLSLKSRRP